MNNELENMRSAMKDTIYSRCLANIKSRIIKEDDITAIFDICLEEIVNAVKASAGTLWIYEKENRMIIPYAVYGGSDLRGIVLVPGQGIAGKVIETGEPIIVDNVNKNRDWANSTDYKTGYTTDAVLCVPVSYAGETAGCIQLINPTNNAAFDKRDIELVNTLIKYLFEAPETSDFVLKLMSQRTSILKEKILDSNVKSMNNVFEYDNVDSVVKAVKSSKKYSTMEETKQRKYIYLVKKIWNVFHKKKSLL